MFNKKCSCKLENTNQCNEECEGYIPSDGKKQILTKDNFTLGVGDSEEAGSIMKSVDFF